MVSDFRPKTHSLSLLGLLRSGGGWREQFERVGEQERAGEHQQRADPVFAVERIGEVPDGEDEADELAERQHQRHGQRSAGLRQTEHRADADVPETAALRKHPTNGRSEIVCFEEK